VGVVPLLGLIFDVRYVDRDAALALFWRIVNRVEGSILPHPSHRTPLRYRCCQGRLAVVNVSHRAHIHVGLTAIKFLLAH
jgi:hypothetical protein